MKLLLCVGSLMDVAGFLSHYSAQLQQSALHSFLHSCKILQHDVDFIESGAGVYQTNYKVTKALTHQKYHLALKIGFGNSYKEELVVGQVLNIINDKPGDYGMMVNDAWQDHYDFGWKKREDEPHVRGGFINMNTSYVNVFAPFKKVVSLTVNHYGNKLAYQLKQEKYKADCETGDGLGFVYPCLYEKQPFYQLCVIERNLVTDEADLDKAKQAMNETLIALLGKL